MALRTVIVTGGAGFIGSHACLQLSAAGYHPVTVDNLRTGHADAVKWGPLEQVDVCDTDAFASVIKRHEAEAVMHFAAAAYVGESVEKPGFYYAQNVGGMISVLAAMERTGLKKLVFSSSCATYGDPDTSPIREDTPQRPINPYGRTKLICEQMIQDNARAWGLHYVMLRYFNASGADPAGQLSERHDPETHLLPLALKATAGTRAALKVFGTDYDTSDGTCVRDYVHVSDLARAHQLAMRYLDDGKESVALNLGTGRGHSILEIITAIEAVTGQRTPWEAADRRPGDPLRLVADTEAASRLLGFKARYTDLTDIMRHAAPTFGLKVQDVRCA
ncbi:UDP-glucose 4-epimerase GalE (plasmid) [Loktanella salsilacus]|uniref:UDP-glucose 4-epimerase GalE n=1 Tax=Loktanella salsilacus TaxID=195913 RepID=UPI0020B8DC2B|nr:UDP-glucose 4-epimerase GalE [Loktanella salsilacus]UTH50128.1 UDP-glucose 4-epimerase GalE [Loktanella salsilacus]